MKYFLTLFYSIFLAFGIMAIVKGIKAYLNLNHIVPWEKTAATIDDVKMLSIPGEKGDSLHELQVKYHFTFNDKIYSKDQIEKIHKGNTHRVIVKHTYDKFKIAKRVSVWVNPKNPNDSAFFPKEKDLPLDFIGWIHFGFLFSVLPIGMLIFTWGFDDLESSILNKIEMIK